MLSGADSQPLSLNAAWRLRVSASGADQFLWTEGRDWTFSECDAEVARFMEYLASSGIRQGAVVAIAAGNRPEVIFTHLALQALGAVTMPVMTTATAEEIQFQLVHSQARYVVTDETALDKITAAVKTMGGNSIPVVSIEGPEHTTNGEARVAPPLVDYDDLSPASLLYTSGSSGRPKGVLLPAGAPVSVARGLVDRINISSGDTMFLPTPLAHAVGLVTAIGTAIHCGCRLALVDRFSPSRFWEQVSASGATVTCLFPAHMNFLLNSAPPRSPHNLRAVFTHAYNQNFVETFSVDLHMCWGMTETGGIMTMSGPMRDRAESGYIGEPMPGAEVAAFAPDGRRLPPGEDGELRLIHRHVMLEYHNDRDATDRTRIDGWICSGDSGRVDDRGRTRFLGRLKNVIKRSGENISAEEVEEALLACPAVSECLVFGIPDKTRSEEVVARLTIRAGVQLDPEDVVDWLQQRLSRHKLPRFIKMGLDPLPKLENGKFDRRSIIAAFNQTEAWDRGR